jgi:hypothetical protein
LLIVKSPISLVLLEFEYDSTLLANCQQNFNWEQLHCSAQQCKKRRQAIERKQKSQVPSTERWVWRVIEELTIRVPCYRSGHSWRLRSQGCLISVERSLGQQFALDADIDLPSEAGIAPGLRCLVRLSSAARFDLVVAITTIDRPALSRLERYLCFFATLSADSREHLAPGWAVPAPLSSPCLAAGGTALGLVSIPFSGEELLVSDAEHESCATIGTLEHLVHVRHQMTSFLRYLAKVRSSKACGQLAKKSPGADNLNA